MISETIVCRPGDTSPTSERHDEFEHEKYLIVPREDNQCTVAIMEVPPGKSAYPYHFHVSITEVFYIISGEGLLETPDGGRRVAAGDAIVLPPGAGGAHKLMNTSATETLRYLDVDTTNPSDVAFYPKSGKVGLLLDGMAHTYYKVSDQVGYYD
jgi:uncharacterized cupin superfamily protein